MSPFFTPAACFPISTGQYTYIFNFLDLPEAALVVTGPTLNKIHNLVDYHFKLKNKKIKWSEEQQALLRQTGRQTKSPVEISLGLINIVKWPAHSKNENLYFLAPAQN